MAQVKWIEKPNNIFFVAPNYPDVAPHFNTLTTALASASSGDTIIVFGARSSYTAKSGVRVVFTNEICNSKKLIATVTQSSTGDPAFTKILFNSTGLTTSGGGAELQLVWARSSTGIYTLTSAVDVFTQYYTKATLLPVSPIDPTIEGTNWITAEWTSAKILTFTQYKLVVTSAITMGGATETAGGETHAHNLSTSATASASNTVTPTATDGFTRALLEIEVFES